MAFGFGKEGINERSLPSSCPVTAPAMQLSIDEALQRHSYGTATPDLSSLPGG